MKYRWKGDDLWNLVNLPIKDLVVLYPECKYLPSTRSIYIRKVRNGALEMPEKGTFDGDLESEGRRVRERQGKAAPDIGKIALQVRPEHIQYHEELEAALEEHGFLQKASFTDWQGFYKDNEGEAHKVDLHRKRFDVRFDHEPDWPPVNRVESRRLARKEKARDPEGIEKAFIFSDVQIPFEDEKALEVALSVMRDTKPDRVVFIGDLLDLSAWSRFDQLPEWATATQGAVDKAHILMATVRKMLPSARIQVIEANHEARMPKRLLQNAKAAYGLKRADQPEGWPVMSIPYLTAMDTLDVEWVPGYPANRVYLSPELQVIHGTITTKGAGARRTSAMEKISTIFGHDHRLSMNVETVNSYRGGEQIRSYGSGCLCRIDGHVPSTKSGLDPSGNAVRNLENWSQGFLIASYVPEGGPFYVEQVAINTLNDYQTMYRGKIYAPREA